MARRCGGRSACATAHSSVNEFGHCLLAMFETGSLLLRQRGERCSMPMLTSAGVQADFARPGRSIRSINFPTSRASPQSASDSNLAHLHLCMIRHCDASAAAAGDRVRVRASLDWYSAQIRARNSGAKAAASEAAFSTVHLVHVSRRSEPQCTRGDARTFERLDFLQRSRVGRQAPFARACGAH